MKRICYASLEAGQLRALEDLRDTGGHSLKMPVASRNNDPKQASLEATPLKTDIQAKPRKRSSDVSASAPAALQGASLVLCFWLKGCMF